jgi:hypothetical protein
MPPAHPPPPPHTPHTHRRAAVQDRGGQDVRPEEQEQEQEGAGVRGQGGEAGAAQRGGHAGRGQAGGPGGGGRAARQGGQGADGEGAGHALQDGHQAAQDRRGRGPQVRRVRVLQGGRVREGRALQVQPRPHHVAQGRQGERVRRPARGRGGEGGQHRGLGPEQAGAGGVHQARAGERRRREGGGDQDGHCVQVLPRRHREGAVR